VPHNKVFKSKNSLYYSSLDYSLRIIGGTDENIINVPHNKVFKIKNGDFKNAEVFDIDRSNCVHESLYSSYSNAYYYNSKKSKQKVGIREVEQDPYYDIYDRESSCGVPRLTSGKNTSSIYYPTGNTEVDKGVIKACKKHAKKSNEISIYHQLIDQNSHQGNVYEHMLRYWRNGQVINGVWTWVPSYGFFWLSKKVEDADNISKSLIGKAFKDGTFTDVEDKSSFIPFKIKEDISFHYFFDGIKVKSHLDLIVLEKNRDVMKDLLLYDNVSKCSSHPIIDLTRYKDPKSQDIKWNGVLYNGTISLLGSNNCYSIVNGNLKKVSEAKANFTKITDGIQEAEIIEEYSNNDMEEETALQAYLESILFDPINVFPLEAKELRERFETSDVALDAASLLESFCDEAANIIGIEINENV
jgi:hypothetical protein